MSSIYIDRTVYDTRPAGPRPTVENETYDLLEKLGIAFSRVDHGEAMTIADCEEIDALLGVSMCKNLFLCNRQKTEFYLLMLPGSKQFQTKILSAQLGLTRLSFAGGEYMERFLNIRPGSLSVLGLAYDTERRVRLFIDTELLACEYIGCHPCVNTSSLKIKTADITGTFLAYTGHIAERVVL